MDKLEYLVQTLSDGEYHSGEELGNSLNVTRAAIWKLTNTLMHWGVDIESSTKKGYRITHGLSLLDKKRIIKHLTPLNRKKLSQLEIYTSLPSTNDYLMETAKTSKHKIQACLAERQTAGKGRRHRQWFSPFAANIYLSLRWTFNKDFSELFGLSLVAAIATVKALQAFGIQDLQLKWPNDILYKQKKLAGILIETCGESNDQLIAVVGVGLNVHMPKSTGEKINQPWTDLYEITQKKSNRNQLAALLLNELIAHMTEFEEQGLVSFLNQWHKFDATLNHKVVLHTPQQDFIGIARGIDKKGCLLLEDNKKTLKAYSIGEISLRLL